MALEDQKSHFMKRSSTPITFQVGHREFVRVNATKYDWRDIYQLILTLSWPRFAGLVLGIYVLITSASQRSTPSEGDAPLNCLRDRFVRLLLQRRNVGYRRVWACLAGHFVRP